MNPVSNETDSLTTAGFLYSVVNYVDETVEKEQTIKLAKTFLFHCILIPS
jgi:hypothetical protein